MVERFDRKDGFNCASSSEQMADGTLSNFKITKKETVEKPVCKMEHKMRRWLIVTFVDENPRFCACSPKSSFTAAFSARSPGGVDVACALM